MCLAIPGKIIEIKDDVAIVEYGKEKREAKLLEKNLKVGDYVIVQNKFVMQKVPEKEALEALKLFSKWNQLLNF